MAGMQVFDVQEDGFQLRTCVVFILKEPQPHVVGVVVDDEQAVAETMWGGDIDRAPEISGHVEEGVGWFHASGCVARCNCGFDALWSKQESEETLFTELADTWPVGTP
jgi:hypothetical protein